MSNLRIKLSLFLNFIVFAILLCCVGIVILLVQKSFGVDKTTAATLEPYKDISAVIITFLITSSLTKIGYKKSMLIVLAITAAACFVIPFFTTFLAVKLLFVIVGAGFAIIKISAFGIVGLVCKNEKEHISLMNFLESCFGIGMVISYFIFARFINTVNAADTSWMNVFFLLGGLTVIALILLLSSPLDESASRSSSQEETVSFADIFKLAVRPIVLIFIGCAFFYILLEQGVMNWLPSFNHDVLKMDETLSIQVAGILAVSIALGRFVSGFLLKRIHWLPFLSACLILSVILIVTVLPQTKQFAEHYTGKPVTSIKDIPIVAFVFPLIGLMLAPVYPVINSIILSSLPKPQHGMMSGLIIIFSAIGASAGALVTGIIFQNSGGNTAFYFLLLPAIVLITLLIMFYKQHNKQAGVVVS